LSRSRPTVSAGARTLEAYQTRGGHVRRVSSDFSLQARRLCFIFPSSSRCGLSAVVEEGSKLGLGDAIDSMVRRGGRAARGDRRAPEPPSSLMVMDRRWLRGGIGRSPIDRDRFVFSPRAAAEAAIHSLRQGFGANGCARPWAGARRPPVPRNRDRVAAGGRDAA
jgi:hypothetical protein